MSLFIIRLTIKSAMIILKDSLLINVLSLKAALLLRNLTYVKMEVVNRRVLTVIRKANYTYKRKAIVIHALSVKMESVEPSVHFIMDVPEINHYIVEVEYVSNNTSIVQDMICVHYTLLIEIERISV